MSVRQFFGLVALIAAVNLAGFVYGNRGRAVVFVLLGVAGLLGAVWYERRRARLRDGFSALPPDAQGEALVYLENTVVRADLLEDVGAVRPPMPLRGPVEHFRYPPEYLRPMRWCMNGGFFVTGLFGLGYISDRLLGTERFYATGQAWTDAAGISGVMLGLSLLMWWFIREMRAVVLVSDEALELRVPGRRVRRIPWATVSHVRYGALSRRLVVTSPTQRIAIGDTLTSYGRLLNLVLARAPRPPRTAAG